ncbi:MAG: DUF2723 domain-containing protein, partial [Flavisolibacter sp.]
GVIGSLAYTFSDTFWFSAVEGEVYAFSSLFTAILFWAMLKWERADQVAGSDLQAKNRADRWIVFIAFAIGLSIGVHLLGLLSIPAIVMIYYYKRYPYTRKGAILAFIIGCIITGIVQLVIIQWSVAAAGKFDIFFINNFHLPFFSGFAFFFLLIGILVWRGMILANKKGWYFLRLGLWSFSFIMLGYSVYVSILERSNANPPIDMNKVDNPMNLAYYLGREQYGSQPVLYGTHFLAQPVDVQESKTRYVRGKDSYIALPPEKEYKYDSKDYQLFQRVWDASNDQGHSDYYIQWLNLDQVTARQTALVTGVSDGIIQVQDQRGKTDTYQVPDDYSVHVQRGQVVQQGSPIAIKTPTLSTSINWFMTYQTGYMFWRYFMWNFAGRQNDLKGSGNIRDSNWLSGISLIDDLRLGDQSKLPQSIRDNKAANKLFMLPFILGILGCVFQFYKNKKDWFVTFLMFFFTGLAIVIYLNQPGNQPRERDYTFAAACYAFSIWIGLAVIAISQLAIEKKENRSQGRILVLGSLLTLIILLWSDINNMNAHTVMAAILGSLLFAVISAGLMYVIKIINKPAVILKYNGLITGMICLAIPVIMGFSEWNDHDRSKKVLAPDMAKDYLNSCPPNALLITFADNDTYPLWYAQEVEGVRPDVRLMITTLMGFDWYVNELRRKINDSAPFDLIWNEDQIRGLSFLGYKPDGTENKPMLLYDVLKNKIGPMLNAEDKSESASFANRHLLIPVDTSYVRKAGMIKANDQVSSQIQIDIPDNKSYLTLDQLAILNVLAANNWKRPVCFTMPYGDIGLNPYLRQQGMVYQMVPVKNNEQSSLDADVTKNLLLNKFRGGGANVPGVYFDEENRSHLLTIRQTYAIEANALADQGRYDEAKEVLNKSESIIKSDDLPYAMVSRDNMHNRISMLYLQAAYKAKDLSLANKLDQALRKDTNDQKNYYAYVRNFREENYGPFANDDQQCDQLLNIMDQWKKEYNAAPIVKEFPGQMRK